MESRGESMSIAQLSHPTRGEWIEILLCGYVQNLCFKSHPTRGEWIEIIPQSWLTCRLRSLTPHGVSGLK